MSWWSDKYNRPLKDPVLLSYTLEELAYEYYLSIERRAADNERIELDNDKIEEAKDSAAQEWADKMEAEEAAESEKAKENIGSADPTLDPANVKWMEQEIEKNKQELGEDFGEDLSLNFEDE